MKKLPKIYQSEINKKINNNRNSCYVEKEDISIKEDYIQPKEEVLDEIFSGIGYAYNIPIIIKTKDQTFDTSLIARTKQKVITLDNEVIPIAEIISIKKKKNF